MSESVGERTSAGQVPSLLIVGTGLIGTSLGLAARAAGYTVWLEDQDPDRLALAESVGAGRRREPDLTGLDVAAAAVPPAAVSVVIEALVSSGVAATVTHLASVQHDPQAQVESLLGPVAGFVGSHPIAGRERSGPHHASADLFTQRPWIVCPTDHSSPTAVAAVSALAQACGAVTTEMSAADHDRLLARLSHAPQLVASALAGSLADLDRREVGLAGTGLRDTTRLADSDSALWTEIISANSQPVAEALRAVIDPLQELVRALDQAPGDDAAAAVETLVRAGHHGRGLMAGKHGQRAVRWASVAVVVPDEPGNLARLLADAASAGVNVEDIRVDHSPGQPLGVVELDVAAASSEELERALRERGWTATASPPPPADPG